MYVSTGERIKSDIRIGKPDTNLIRLGVEYPTSQYLNSSSDYIWLNDYDRHLLVQSLRFYVYGVALPEMLQKGGGNGVRGYKA